MDTLVKSGAPPTPEGRENVEAIRESHKVWSAGLENMAEIMANAAQAHMDHTFATLKALSGAKTLKEVVDLQSAATVASLDQVLASTNKLSSAAMKLAEEGIAPITARTAAVAETFAQLGFHRSRAETIGASRAG